MPIQQVTRSFDSKYYSGIDIGIYIGNSFLEEGVSLQFQIVENNIPYYGYGSYTWRRIAKGTRMVQGSFAINFVEPNYLRNLISPPPTDTGILQNGALTEQADISMMAELGVALGGGTDLSGWISMVKKGGNIDPNKVKKVDKAFKKAFSDPITKEVIVDGPLYDFGPNGLDITVRYSEPKEQILPFILDDRRTWGNADVTRQHTPTSEIGNRKTTIQLIGCEISGVGQALDDSGRPIMEIYNFLGKDIKLT